jgi:YesN/AraC family two-component response regulator
MTQPLLLWSNFAASGATAAICDELETRCRVVTTAAANELPRTIEELQPDVICFDFDYPDAAALKLVRTIKQQYPSVPILMFTADHSRDLLIWALRTRVWDCFLKPVAATEVLRCLDILLPVLARHRGQAPRRLLLPEQRTTGGAGDVPARRAPSKTAKVLPYILKHYPGKVVLADVARMCSLNPFDFSRTFKREHGVTFRDYLTGVRIQEAARLLSGAGASVVDIACAVGFNDHSQFSRLFRRHMGVTPRAYRSGNSNGQSALQLLPQTPETLPAS